MPGRSQDNMDQDLEYCTFPSYQCALLAELSSGLMVIRRYYVLVATCVFARKEEWLRGACLAAALLFPAVAAIHGIVLAAVHVNGEDTHDYPLYRYRS